MAGAPRTRSDLIASHTPFTSRHSISTSSIGSRVWSINTRWPSVLPTQASVGMERAGSAAMTFLLRGEAAAARQMERVGHGFIRHFARHDVDAVGHARQLFGSALDA